MRKNLIRGAILILAFILLPQTTKAVELITNGGFETGTFAGWTAINPTGPFEPWAVSGSGSGWVDSPLPSATQVIEGTRNAWNTVTSSPAGSFLLYQDVTIPGGRSVQFKWLHRYQMNLSTYCSNAAECGTATFAVEILNTSNVLLQTMYTITTPSLANTNTGWVSNFLNLSAYSGSTIRIRFRTTVTAPFGGPGKIEIDGVSVNAFIPTSATAVLGGRVLTDDGRGIGMTRVMLTDVGGNVRSALTNPFGYYQFDNIATGQTYFVSAANKRYIFINSPRVITLNVDLADVNFTAAP